MRKPRERIDRSAAFRVCAVFISLLASTGTLPSASATPAVTTVQISGLEIVDGKLNVDGNLTLGSDAAAPVQVVNDLGDFTGEGVVPNTDIGKGWIETDLAEQTLTYTWEINNPTQTPRATPFINLLWRIRLDEVFPPERPYLMAGIAGSGLPSADPNGIFRLCKLAPGPVCRDEMLEGSLENGKGKIVLPMSLVNVQPGSVLMSASPSYPDLETVVNAPGIIQDSSVGDNAFAAEYVVPGGVEVAVVNSDTPPAGIRWYPGTVGGDGTFTASGLPLAGSGLHKVMVRSCFGTTCVSDFREFTA